MQTANCALFTEYGEFQLHGFVDAITGQEHAGLTLGDIGTDTSVLARVHSECLSGDVFGSLHCDCGAQWQAAMRTVAAERRGVLLYLRQEGRGIGLLNKIRAYDLQSAGADTVDANRLLGLPDDARSYGAAGAILRHLGISAVRLMTNNPAKVAALTACGIEVAERVPLLAGHTPHNKAYLVTKGARFGHLLGMQSDPTSNDVPVALQPTASH